MKINAIKVEMNDQDVQVPVTVYGHPDGKDGVVAVWEVDHHEGLTVMNAILTAGGPVPHELGPGSTLIRIETEL